MHPWASPRLVEAQGRGRRGWFSLGASPYTAEVGSIGVTEHGQWEAGFGGQYIDLGTQTSHPWASPMLVEGWRRGGFRWICL